MSRAPSLQAATGACDTNVHCYDGRYPLAPTALSTPPDKGVGEYRAVQRRLGITRVVVVQPTAYGLDNRCTLDAVAALGEGARAVVMVDEGVTAAELARMAAAGARGARFHMFPGGILGWDRLDALAPRIAEAGWHIQLQMDGRGFAEREAQVRGWPGRVVIDHVGKFGEPVAPEDPAFAALLRLVDTGRVWVKLSAPYETSRSGPPAYADVGALASALVRHAPERMLWATNWPHLALRQPPDDADLLDLLLDWAPEEAARRRILVDNPAEVYGFGPP